MATGQSRFLGSCYSTAQAPNFAAYFNQVTPENAGKWGSVEATRDVMNWTELDAAYNYAKTNGLKFRFHVLVWGSQQPAWISALTPAEKLDEIKEWFAAVAARYPDLDYVEVVNEPLHAPPNGGQIAFSTPAVYAANYSDALGGAGASGWEWLVQSFRLARQYFPGKKLVLNEYGLLNDASSALRYVQIVNLLKAENLVDVISTQAHAFETTGVPTQTLTNNLATLAATGVPVMITEMDIDGATDQVQLTEYQRVFPILWNNPSVIGITLWGYRPGLWRNAEGAYLVLADNTERPAMQWLKTYVGNFPPVVTASQVFPVQTSAVNGTVVGTLLATDANAGTTFQGWATTGGTGASYFAINAANGQVTVSNRAGLDLVGVGSYTLQVTVSDGIATSAAGTVTILTPASAPSATAQPVAVNVTEGADASFTFGASSPVAMGLQWQVSTNAGSSWTNLTNGGVYSTVTGATLQLIGVTIAMNDYRYRCVGTNLAGTTTSAAVALTVNPAFPAVPAGFDAAGYLARNPDVAAAIGDVANKLTLAWQHYWTYGLAEGRMFDDGFQADDYLAINPDLQAVFGTDRFGVLQHWLTYGKGEGRLGRVPPQFELDAYFALNPDVLAVFGNNRRLAWFHYATYGILEGRSLDGWFTPAAYLAMYPDLVPALAGKPLAALGHWFTYGRAEGRGIPDWFDVVGYLARYPDI